MWQYFGAFLIAIFGLFYIGLENNAPWAVSILYYIVYYYLS